MYDEDEHKTIENLISVVEGQMEGLRLGFFIENDNETLFVSPVDMG